MMKTVPTYSDKLVVLKFDGDFENQGFRVTLEIGIDGHRPKVEEFGSLPTAPHLTDCLTEFKHLYRNLGGLKRVIRPQLVLSQETPRSRLNRCRQKGKELAAAFSAWLNSNSFQPLDRRLREELSRQDRIRILVRSQNPIIQQMPWHKWDFIERYPKSEIILGTSSAEISENIYSRRKHRKVRILAILGHSADIDVETDRNLLSRLPGAEVCFLPQPKRKEVSRLLWEESWDILFFAGHSETEETKGYISLNPEDKLSLDELRYGLGSAISNGLKLAVFNSCDGLGIAHELESLNLPQMIVMREPVPDRVAQSFLKAFLHAFSHGETLPLATREARERLEGIEDEFPCASWLPVLCQNSAASTFDWQLLWRNSQKVTFKVKNIVQPILISLVVASFVFIIRLVGLLQAWELQSFDHLMAVRPNLKSVDERVLVVTIDEADIGYQRQQGIKGEGSLSDEALLLLLKAIDPYQPRVVGLDIIHDFPFEPETAQYLAKRGNFVSICRFGSLSSRLPAMPPPDGFPSDQLGFTDVPLDPDRVIRRHYFGMASQQTCNTSQSLNFQIAWSYLNQETTGQLFYEKSDTQLRINDVTFHKVASNSGSYQLAENEVDGYQVLIDYRNTFEIVHLRDILTFDSTRLNRLVRDRAILIGVDNGKDDLHQIPIESSRLPGVVVQAHMVSHILGAVLDRHPPLTWWTQPLELLWITVWSMVIGATYQILKKRFWRLGASTFLIVLLYGVCFYAMLIDGLWLPLVPTGIAIFLTGLVMADQRF